MRDLKEREKVAHEFARDSIKHLVTLATASIGILIAIFKDLLGAGVNFSMPQCLWWAILLFGGSVLFGSFGLNSLTGNVEKKKRPTIYDSNVKWFVVLQIICFVLALVFSGLAIQR